MVLSGIVARPSVCLRCQLREVLLQARIRRGRTPTQTSRLPQRCNAFSTRPWNHQIADEGILVKREKPYYWKKVKTPERVIGRPGRRQRVVSERLSTNSLDKPANVIVFKDVAEAPEVRSFTLEVNATHDVEPRPKALTAKEIEDAITGHYIAPAEAEVNLSIEGLRPQETVVNEGDFEDHKQRLMNGYTYPQLSKYLTWSFRAAGAGLPAREQSANDGEVQELGGSTWRGGQSHLRQRHSNVVKKARTATKIKLVDQILRLAWHLTVQSEEQEIGELEIRLQAWQMTMLFDILQNDRPQYQSFIRSQILLDTTQVQPYRPDGIMRITGRRQDAEEVARQLKLALLKAERLDVDFKPFRKGAQHFSAEELGYVSNLTKTVIVAAADNTLAVYGVNEDARYNARRLLLALMGLPGILSFNAVSQMGKKISDQPGLKKAWTALMLPAELSSGLHRRDRGRALMRRMEPHQRKAAGSSQSFEEGSNSSEASFDHPLDSPASAGAEHMSKSVVQELASVPLPRSRQIIAGNNTGSYWRSEPSWTSWVAEYGEALHTETSLPNKTTETDTDETSTGENPRIFQFQVPGLQNLLSFFESDPPRRYPNDWRTEGNEQNVGTGSRQTPYLTAHFVPSPSGKTHRKLPRIEIRFRLSSPGPDTPPELLLVGIIAIIDEQHLTIPLTERAADVRFGRRLALKADLVAAGTDEAIRALSSKLRQSSQHRSGLLKAPPELTFRLPRALVEKSRKPTKYEDVEVQYLFERFEQVQRIHFTPRQRVLDKEVDEEVKSLVRSMPKDMLLDYREVEGGAIYGSRTMLRLRRDRQGVPEDDVYPLGTHGKSESLTEPAEDVLSPQLDTDTATVSKSAEADERSQARTTYHGGDQAPESTSSDVQPVEKSAESSKDRDARTKELVSTALKIASLLTRATSGSLRQYGSQK